MKKLLLAFVMTSAMVTGLCAPAAWADTLTLSPETDARYAGVVVRDADGNIKRSAAELRKFQMLHPCPSTGQTTGACPNWAIDHVIPLACGGADKVINMQWLPLPTKSCAHNYCKDRWERKIQYVDMNMSGLSVFSCRPLPIPADFFNEPVDPAAPVQPQ